MYSQQPCLPIDVKYIDRFNGDECNPVYDKEVLQKALEKKRVIEEKAMNNIVCLKKKQKKNTTESIQQHQNILLVRKYS